MSEREEPFVPVLQHHMDTARRLLMKRKKKIPLEKVAEFWLNGAIQSKKKDGSLMYTDLSHNAERQGQMLQAFLIVLEAVASNRQSAVPDYDIFSSEPYTDLICDTCEHSFFDKEEGRPTCREGPTMTYYLLTNLR